MAGTSPAMTVDSKFLLLRWRRLGLGGFFGVGLRCLRLGRSLFGLVHALDPGGLAPLGDIIPLRLSRGLGLYLPPVLLEFGRLAVSLFLGPGDVAAELRLY